MNPPTLLSLKAALVIDYSRDDARLSDLLSAAIDLVERATGRAIRQRDHVQYFESFGRAFLLAVAPVRSISAIQYERDTDGGTATLPAENWYLDNTALPLVRVRFRGSMPTDVRPASPRVLYSVGDYTLPSGLSQCIISLVGLWYNHPEAAGPVNLSELPLSFRFVLEQYRMQGVA